MIEIKNLSKHFGSLRAVDDLCFDVPEGQVLGFLGPNGAGKSTTMKMITGFLTPTSGSISVCGFDIEKEPVAAKSVIGYLPEGAPGYGEMTPMQFLGFVANTRGLNGNLKDQRMRHVIEQLHLEQVANQSLETLSKGFRRRVGLAQALLHDPAVLILDEPTDGLDPNQKHEVRQLIGELAEDKIVIVSTHILEEVEAVCDRAIIIAHGRVLADETPAALCEKSQYHNAVRLDVDEIDDALEAISRLDKVNRVERHPSTGQIIAIPKAGQSLYQEMTQLIGSRQWQVNSISVEQGRLDEVFRQITSEGAA